MQRHNIWCCEALFYSAAIIICSSHFLMIFKIFSTHIPTQNQQLSKSFVYFSVFISKEERHETFMNTRKRSKMLHEVNQQMRLHLVETSKISS